MEACMNLCEFCNPPKEDDRYILFDSPHWRIYLANCQNYPGRCIVPLHRHCANLADLTVEELLDFHKLVKMMETIWREVLGATNFNWSCLMNGAYAAKPYNPHVHFHFIPRFDHVYRTENTEFVDSTYGNHYTLSNDFQLCEEDRAILCRQLKERIAAYAWE